MASFRQLASSSLDLPPDSYIYSICPLTIPSSQSSSPLSPLSPSSTPQQRPRKSIANGGTVSVISSDNSLRFVTVTPTGLALANVIHNTHPTGGVTAQARFEDDPDVPSRLVGTAGRDGVVRMWDVRSGRAAITFQTATAAPLSALTCSSSRNAVITGTELPDRGPGDAPISLFDVRNPSTPSTTYPDSHTDTITSLVFHPSRSSPFFISGSTDGLVNVFDSSMPDEDDALVQVINHHSAVHVAGFVSATTVFALGTDETLSFYHAPVGGNRGGQQQQQDEEEDIPPVEFGDLRPRLGGADYVVDLVTSPTGTAQPFLAAGSFSEQWLDLVPLANGTGASVTGLDWSVRPEARVRIPGAHGEELVRHIYAEIDAQSTDSLVLSCGEDGHLRLWSSTAPDAGRAGKQKKKSREPAIFRPY